MTWIASDALLARREPLLKPSHASLSPCRPVYSPTSRSRNAGTLDTTALFKRLAGLDIVHVPYRGGAQAASRHPAAAASIGEESGSLDQMLSKAAEFYEDEVDEMVKGLSSLMEPFIIVILGVLIGGIVVSMYLPIFKLGAVV